MISHGWLEQEGSRDGRCRGMGGVAGWKVSRDGRGRLRVGRYLPRGETVLFVKVIEVKVKSSVPRVRQRAESWWPRAN